MATRNKNKLAALSKKNCEEHPRTNLAQNSNVPRSQEDFITQVSEEFEGRVTKKLSQEFSRTQNRILGALARLDDFLTNPLIQGHSGTAPETSRNVFSRSQKTNEEESQSNPLPEAGIFHNQTAQNSGPEVGHDMVTGVQKESFCGHEMVAAVQKESLCGHDMVTGATGKIRNRHDIVTGVHEEATYCSPSTSSGKQKKNHSINQLKFSSENTPATMEADQILLPLQQLANNNNSANFHNKINRISKLPKLLTTTMPTFDGKSEKFELFEDLFQTSLKFHNQWTEDDRINYFHSLMRGDALQTFKNINGSSQENLVEILPVFPRKYVKPQSMARVKRKFQKTVFNPANRKLVDFLDEFKKPANDAFGIAVHATIEQFIYANLPPHLKKSRNQAHLENGTYEQIVTHLESDLELNVLEAPNDLQTNTVIQHATNTNVDRPKPTCHHCEKPLEYRNQCYLLKKKEQVGGTQTIPGKKNSGSKNSIPSNKKINNRNKKRY